MTREQDDIQVAQRDIIVIGASAGGISALTTLVRGLPQGFPAAIFVVVHIPPHAVSQFAGVLGRAGPLPALPAQRGETIVPGRISVAVPDRRLLVRQGWIELARGPGRTTRGRMMSLWSRSTEMALGQTPDRLWLAARSKGSWSARR